MSQTNPQNPQQPSNTTPSTPSAPVRPKRSWRVWLYRAGFVALGLFLVAGLGLVGAEYYTSQPKFCGTCHVMDPYYESWSHDPHGAKVGVKCVDCHYAPGEQHTIKAKFKGLSQVASYFSGRYGSGRPRAHVADASCMRSGCHAGQAFSEKLLPLGEARTEKRLISGVETEVRRLPSVHFVHKKHLDIEGKRKEITSEIDSVRATLKAALSPEVMEGVEKIATSIKPAADRMIELRDLGNRLRVNETDRANALKLVQLEHRRIRVDQLEGLNCSACHAFNATLNTHIAADRQVCYTCHFMNEEFNRQTSECLLCHEPPTRSVRIHDSAPNASSPSVVMDHQDIVRRGVDCASCHLDVVRGVGPVSDRECTHCHDQSKFLQEFAARTTETVRKYHEVHIAQQRAHCFDCHKAVQHGLVAPGTDPTVTAGFLEPVLNDCKHCHPNHHSEQVALLTGRGGVDVAHSTPNAMIGSRLNCRACHTEETQGGKGDDIVRATQQGCAGCHGDDYVRMFDQWKHEIHTYVTEGDAGWQRVSQAVEAARKSGKTISPEIDQSLHNAKVNLDLVRNGGGMHNRQFALQLLDAARRDVATAEEALAGKSE